MTKTKKADAKPSVEELEKKAKKAAKKAKKAAKKAHAKVEASVSSEKLSKIIEHPLVGELLAVGATAAVAALAERAVAKPGSEAASNARAVKKAGKAAATAIGARLVAEFRTVKDAAVDAAKKA